MAIVHLCIILCLQVVVTLWSVDGLWKLVYPVCMYRVPKEIAGFSGQLKYVDTCPGQPMHGKAFCEEHCQMVAEKGIPSGLCDFLKYCGVSKGWKMLMNTRRNTGLLCHFSIYIVTDPENGAATVDDIKKVSQASKGLEGGSSFLSAADCQGK